MKRFLPALTLPLALSAMDSPYWDNKEETAEDTQSSSHRSQTRTSAPPADGTNPFDQTSDEVGDHIASFLSPRDLDNFSRADRRSRTLSKRHLDREKIIWEKKKVAMQEKLRTFINWIKLDLQLNPKAIPQLVQHIENFFHEFRSVLGCIKIIDLTNLPVNFINSPIGKFNDEDFSKSTILLMLLEKLPNLKQLKIDDSLFYLSSDNMESLERLLKRYPNLTLDFSVLGTSLSETGLFFKGAQDHNISFILPNVSTLNIQFPVIFLGNPNNFLDQLQRRIVRSFPRLQKLNITNLTNQEDFASFKRTLKEFLSKLADLNTLEELDITLSPGYTNPRISNLSQELESTLDEFKESCPSLQHIRFKFLDATNSQETVEKRFPQVAYDDNNLPPLVDDDEDQDQDKNK